jgi:hypothetical protein
LKCFSNSNSSSFNGNSSTLNCCNVFTSINKVSFKIQPFEFNVGPYMEELHVLVVGGVVLVQEVICNS